jgi:hypothetical protein
MSRLAGFLKRLLYLSRDNFKSPLTLFRFSADSSLSEYEKNKGRDAI